MVKKMPVFTIDFQPVGRRGQCPGNESFLDCARRVGIGISNVCGGGGTCGTCKVQVLVGTVSEPTPGELDALSPHELNEGWRLACQTYPTSDCTLHVPPESMTTPQRTQVEGLEIAVTPEPPLQSFNVQLSTPSLSDLQADADRLLQALNQQHRLKCKSFDIHVLQDISNLLRSHEWQCYATVRNNEVVALVPPSNRQLGLAVDLGTTKIAGYLIDLNSGKTLAARGIMNPQISYGEDVISRINNANNSQKNSMRLQQVLIKALNELIVDLSSEIGVSKTDIVEMVVVGNTAMHHLFLGLAVKQLAVTPFVPAVNSSLDVKAHEPGLNIAPGAYVYLPPNIAGFVGGDHVAMLLAAGVSEAEGPVITLDIGTNTEVSLVYKGEITSVSCASGPVFEGGHIKDGMRAASGAIERVRITGEKIQLETIDDTPATGICGSGILDAMAQLYLNGIINEAGKMNTDHPRSSTHNKQPCFVLVSKKERGGRPGIIVTQKDIRELQLGKAAIRTGIQSLLETNGCCEEDIKQVIIAGAFGSYIDISSAITIGMLPSLPLDRFKQVGNAAGMGARMALISRTKRNEARGIAKRVRYLELAGTPGFMDTFVAANYIGQYRITGGERQEID